jgi:hypothetical protein
MTETPADAQSELASYGRTPGFSVQVDELAGFEGIPAAERYLRRLAIRRGLAAVQIRPPPCDSCAWSRRCATHQLACGAFARYVNSGKLQRPDMPTRERYRALFNDE